MNEILPLQDQQNPPPIPPPKSKRFIYFGACLVILIIAITGAFFIWHLIQTNVPLPTTSSTINESDFVTSSTNPDFNTYTNKQLGFSVQVPKEALNLAGSCSYIDRSYNTDATTTPIAVAVQNNNAYIDFAWMYNLTGSHTEPAGPGPGEVHYFSGCVKQDISQYLPLWFQSSFDFSRTPPIRIYTHEATSTQAAKAIALKEYHNFSGDRCSYTIQESPSTQQDGVTDYRARMPEGYMGVAGEPDPCPDIGPPFMSIKYYPAINKVAVIILPTFMGCSLSKDGNFDDKTPPSCFDSQIVDSFRFLR